jgi:peroxiredoxin Q/BCP
VFKLCLSLKSKENQHFCCNKNLQIKNLPMSLPEKSMAPDFTLASTSGDPFTLSKTAASKPLILYFYPKDFTAVCTKEACEFRDSFGFFRDLNVDVYGISRDNIPTHHEFKKAHNLPFDLLADEDGQVADLYKATIPIIRFTKRITYLLDAQHHIAAVYTNLFGAKKHISEMIKQIKSGNL